MTYEAKKTPQQFYAYSRKRIYASVLIVCSLYISVGLINAWSSPAIVLLENQNLSNHQKTLLASLPTLAPGPLITMFSLDNIGRRYTMLIIWFILMVSWIMMCISIEVNVLLASRFVSGWGLSALFSAAGIYISEISDVGVRGPLNTITMVFVTVGNIIADVIGPFTSFMWLNGVSTAVSAIFGLFFWYIPESPYYYVKKEKTKEARKTLLWISMNATKDDVEDELSKIQNSIEEEKKTRAGFRKLFSSKTVFKEFAVAWYLLYFQQLCGIGPLKAYFLPIFKAANLSFKAAYVPIAISVLALFAGFPTPFLVKKFGNKIIFVVAGFVTAFGHALLALYFCLLERNYDVSSITWLPISAAFLLMGTVYMGISGVVWAVVSDLFPPSVKGYATGVSGIISTFLGFLSSELFGLSKDAFNYGPTFCGYSIALFISCFGLFFIPNVSHMTLQEIQGFFKGKDSSTKLENQET